MSDDSETVEDTEKGSLAEVTDDSCTAEFIEIVPLDRASDDYHKLEFIDPVVEIKTDGGPSIEASDDYHTPEFSFTVVKVKPEDLQEMKQEPADEYETGEHETEAACFNTEVS